MTLLTPLAHARYALWIRLIGTVEDAPGTDGLLDNYRDEILRDAAARMAAAADDDSIGGQLSNYLGEGIGYAANMIDPDFEEG